LIQDNKLFGKPSLIYDQNQNQVEMDPIPRRGKAEVPQAQKSEVASMLE